MFGELQEGERVSAEGRGIVPRVCEEVFAAMKSRAAELGLAATLAVSYVEIFGNEGRSVGRSHFLRLRIDHPADSP